MTLSAALLETWLFGSFLCKLVHFTSTLTALISTFTVAVIAVERWFFIVNKQKFDRRCTIVTLILLWLISILIALPEFLSRQVEEVLAQNVFQFMMKIPGFASNRPANETNFPPEVLAKLKPPCPVEKIYYCVTTPGPRTRIFSYIIMTVQYLVPFLFVSVSCYSISRFLERRMNRMRAYQRPVRTNSHRKKKQNLNHHDEITEHELTSFDDSPLAFRRNSDKTTTHHSFFICFRHSSQQQRNSFQLPDHHQFIKTQSHTERRFHRSRKLLICVAALFTVSWLPLTIIQIYLDHNVGILETRDGANYVYGYLLIPCYLISSLSAWMNPVIYNYINRSFRREFYSLYSCCLPKSTLRKESTTIESLKRHRTEPTVIESTLNGPTHTRLGAKQSAPVVSFADETIVMMHRQNDS